MGLGSECRGFGQIEKWEYPWIALYYGVIILIPIIVGFFSR